MANAWRNIGLAACGALAFAVFKCATNPDGWDPFPASSLSDPTNETPASGEDFSDASWLKTEQIGGAPRTYWDYYGCIRRNFPTIADHDQFDEYKETISEYIESTENRVPSDDEIVGTAKFPAFIGKLACSRRWNWGTIHSLSAKLDQLQLSSFLPVKTRRIQESMDAALEASGHGEDVELRNIAEGLMILRWSRDCAPAYTRKGCKDLATMSAEKRALMDQVARTVDFHQLLGQAEYTPTRLRLHPSLDIFMYTDYSNRIEYDDIVQTPLINSNTPTVYLAGILASSAADGDTVPVTANFRADQARGLLVTLLASLLKERDALRTENPSDFYELTPLSIVFVHGQAPPNCGGLVVDRLGYYCPNEGLIFVTADDVGHASPKTYDQLLYGEALSVIAHELSHYALRRKSWANEPFMDEGYATAMGERQLRSTSAALSLPKRDPAAYSTYTAHMKSNPDDVAWFSRASNALIAKSPLTRTQHLLLCAIPGSTVSAAEIEKYLKEGRNQFNREGLAGYSIAWITFEGLLPDDDSTKNVGRLSTIAGDFNGTPNPEQILNGRRELQRIAETATDKLVTLKMLDTVSCSSGR